jgi:hypothetical protein
MKTIDKLIDASFFVLVAIVGWLFYMGMNVQEAKATEEKQTYYIDTVCTDAEICIEDTVFTRPSTTIVTVPELREHEYVTFDMLDTLTPYAVYAYTTVVAESGWPDQKSHLAKAVNNNIGMMVPVSRFNAATIKDTAAIRRNLGLVFGKDYTIYKYAGKAVKNMQGDTMVCYNGKWAIFPTAEACARDIAEYQLKNIRPKDAVSPKAYLRRLEQLNYFTKSDAAQGYRSHWLQIYERVKQEYMDWKSRKSLDYPDGDNGSADSL